MPNTYVCMQILFPLILLVCFLPLVLFLFFLLSLILLQGFIQRGGCPGISPPKVQFPPPPPRISYHNVIMNQIENCTSINAYRLMRLFFCLNMSKISAKLTEFSSGPSIAIRMSLVKLESFNRFRSRVFIIFI